MRVTWSTHHADGTYTSVEVEDVESQDLPAVFAMQNPEAIAEHLIGPIERIAYSIKDMFK